MLVTPHFKYDPTMDTILNLIGQGGPRLEPETGIFITNTFSLGNLIANEKDDWYDFQDPDKGIWYGSYGVCDNVEQVKTRYAQWLEDPELKFCINFCKVKKSDQPEMGGWRWHKWGEYIGELNPQHEYLYDEDDSIQEVFCYHIYKLVD